MGYMDFIDSFQCLAASLGKLMSNLKVVKHLQAFFIEIQNYRSTTMGFHPYHYGD